MRDYTVMLWCYTKAPGVIGLLMRLSLYIMGLSVNDVCMSVKQFVLGHPVRGCWSGLWIGKGRENTVLPLDLLCTEGTRLE